MHKIRNKIMHKIIKVHFRKISSTVTAHHYQTSCRTLFIYFNIVRIRRPILDNIILCVTVSNRNQIEMCSLFPVASLCDSTRTKPTYADSQAALTDGVRVFCLGLARLALNMYIKKEMK